MQLPSTLAQLPERIELQRNGLPFTAERVELLAGVSSGNVRLADAGSEDSFTPVPFAKGPVTAYAYVWPHPKRGPINTAVLLHANGIQGGSFHEVEIEQTYAGHVGGVPVDGGAISISFGNVSCRVESGFGDGAFPVYGCKRLLRAHHLLLVDFLIWKVKKVILMPGRVFDPWNVAVDE